MQHLAVGCPLFTALHLLPEGLALVRMGFRGMTAECRVALHAGTADLADGFELRVIRGLTDQALSRFGDLLIRFTLLCFIERSDRGYEG